MLPPYDPTYGATTNTGATSAATGAANAHLDLWFHLSLDFPIGQQPGQQPYGCIPPPSPEMCGPPAGRGLTKNPDGSVTTAGGYKIVPSGSKAAWEIYGPDGNKLTRVQGDPHVYEADGTKWDFTKSSNFVLPDGTRIGAKTKVWRADKPGQTATDSLDIANGNDRIQIGGIKTNKPVTGEITHDGIDGWQQANAGRDTFKLTHDDRRQNWVKYDRNETLKGVVTGAYQQTPGGIYIQKTNGRDSALQQTPIAFDEGARAIPDMPSGQGPFSAGGLEQYFQNPRSGYLAYQMMRQYILDTLMQHYQVDFGMMASIYR